MNTESWRDRRVPVTGHTGFKGSWLCLWLDMLDAKVCGYTLDPPTDPSLYGLASVDELIESTLGEVSDLLKLRSLVASFATEVVIHMAAQSVVLDSYDDPVETYRTNVLGTIHILEAVRLAGIKCTFANGTTDKYDENRGLSVLGLDSDRLGGRDPYSNSKVSSELVRLRIGIFLARATLWQSGRLLRNVTQATRSMLRLSEEYTF